MLLALKFLVGYSFFVYLGIAYFSNQFLMIPYILIPIFIFINIFENKKHEKKSVYLFSLISIYVISVSINLLTGIFGDSVIVLAINFLIFIFILIAFSHTILNIKTLSSFLNIYLLCLTCVIGYGAFQIAFGYRDFELKSIERMGSLLIEYEKMGRFRVTSTFVDPLLCSFSCCIGFFLCWLKIAIGNIDQKFRVNNFALKFLAIASLFMMASTLTRAPILGLIIGVTGSMLTYYSINFKSFFKIILISVVTILIPYILLDGMDESEIIDYPDIFKTIISMRSLFSSIDPSDSSYFLVGQSRDHRLNAIAVAFDYMIDNFGNYGDSITNPALLNISFVDIGLLKIGVLSGLVSYILLEIIYLYFLYVIWKVAIKEDDKRHRLIASIIFGLWLSIMIAINISDISLAIMPSIFIWMVGAIICNYALIFKKK